MKSTNSTNRYKDLKNARIRWTIMGIRHWMETTPMKMPTIQMSTLQVSFWVQSMTRLLNRRSVRFAKVSTTSTSSFSKRRTYRTCAHWSIWRRIRRTWIRSFATLASNLRTNTCLAKSSMNGNSHFNSQVILITLTSWTNSIRVIWFKAHW